MTDTHHRLLRIVEGRVLERLSVDPDRRRRRVRHVELQAASASEQDEDN